MTKSIDEAFEDYLKRLTPLPTENKAAQSHWASVRACMKNNFATTKFFHTGSFGNGTAIRRRSDVDYFAVIPRPLINNNSSDTLNRVRAALKTTFHTSKVGIRTPAVFIPFGPGGREAIDVVPAVYVGKTPRGKDIYDIPDRAGGWMRSSPSAHKAYVKEQDDRLEHRVKPLVMLVKAWKYYWSVPILSFYLEMRVARYASTVKSIDYLRGLERVFESMISDDHLKSLQDPVGISRHIHPCETQAQEKAALKKVRMGLGRVADARKNESSGKTEAAFDRIDLFFNGTFPLYK